MDWVEPAIANQCAKNLSSLSREIESFPERVNLLFTRRLVIWKGIRLNLKSIGLTSSQVKEAINALQQTSARKISNLEAKSKKGFPEGRSTTKLYPQLDRIVVGLRYALTRVDPEFDAIRGNSSDGWFWSDNSRPDATLFKLNNLLITEKQVLWRDETVPPKFDGTEEEVYAKLIFFLASHENQIVSHVQIARFIWPNLKKLSTLQISAMVRFRAASARRRLRSLDPHFNHIRTINEVGYIWFDADRLEPSQKFTLRFDPGENAYFFKGQRVKLRPTGVRILSALMDAAPKRLTFEQLADVVWNSREAGELSAQERGALKVHIHNIRRAFRDIDGRFSSIDSDSDGYSWVDELPDGRPT